MLDLTVSNPLQKSQEHGLLYKRVTFKDSGKIKVTIKNLLPPLSFPQQLHHIRQLLSCKHAEWEQSKAIITDYDKTLMAPCSLFEELSLIDQNNT